MWWEEILKCYEEQKKIVNPILDSVYLKLLSPDTTKETMLQMVRDAVINDKWGGISYLKGCLSIKLTENFLNGNEINSQQYYKALEILKSLSLDGLASFEIFEEYDESPSDKFGYSIATPIKYCVINMAVRKFKQENHNLSELFKILDKLDLDLDLREWSI